MRWRSFALLTVLATATVFVHAQTYTFTTLDYPGATMTNPNAVNRAGADHGAARDGDVDRTPERLHPGAACLRGGSGGQKRERTARASRRRPPRGDPAARTSTASKRKSSSSSVSVPRV